MNDDAIRQPGEKAFDVAREYLESNRFLLDIDAVRIYQITLRMRTKQFKRVTAAERRIDPAWIFERLSEVKSLDDLVEAARQDPDAFEVSREWAAELISKSQPLPSALAGFAAAYLRGTLVRPKRAGQHPMKQHFWKLEIARAVQHVRDQCGIPPTRNEERKTVSESACDAVAQAASSIMFGKADLSFEHVKKIWSSHKRYL